MSNSDCCNSNYKTTKYISTVAGTIDGYDRYIVESNSTEIALQDINLTISAKAAELSKDVFIADAGGLLGTNQKIIIKSIDNSSYIFRYENVDGTPYIADSITIDRPYASVTLTTGIKEGSKYIIQVVVNYNRILNNGLNLESINKKLFGSKDYVYSADGEEQTLDQDYGVANIRLMTYKNCSIVIPPSLVGSEGDGTARIITVNDFGGNTSGLNVFKIKWVRNFFVTGAQEVHLQTAYSCYQLSVGNGIVGVINSGTNVPIVI